jgi:hypothetical protein
LNLAAGWASDAEGESLYPLEPGGERQHELSLRGGVNLVMYTLTGNYKSDQVHVRDLLERLVRLDAYQQECKSLRAAIKEGVNRINAGRTYNKLEVRDQPGGPHVLGLTRFYLKVSLCRRAPPMLPGKLPEDPVRHRQYELDYLPSKNYVWKQKTDHNRSFSSESLAEEILKWYLDNGEDACCKLGRAHAHLKPKRICPL